MPSPGNANLAGVLALLLLSGGGSAGLAQGGWLTGASGTLEVHVLEPLPSGIDLRWETEGARRTWAEVRQDGRAWERVEPDPGRSGEDRHAARVLGLEPDAPVEVRFAISDPSRETVTRFPDTGAFPARTGPRLRFPSLRASRLGERAGIVRLSTSEVVEVRVLHSPEKATLHRYLRSPLGEAELPVDVRAVRSASRPGRTLHLVHLRGLDPEVHEYFAVEAVLPGTEVVVARSRLRVLDPARARSAFVSSYPGRRSLLRRTPTLSYLPRLMTKEALVKGRSTASTFSERRMRTERWVHELDLRGVELPPSDVDPRRPRILDELEYLKALYYVNAPRAMRRLDNAVTLLASLDDRLDAALRPEVPAEELLLAPVEDLDVEVDEDPLEADIDLGEDEDLLGDL